MDTGEPSSKTRNNQTSDCRTIRFGPFLYFSLCFSDFMDLGTRVVCLNNNLDYYVETLVTLITGKMTSRWANRNEHLSPDTPTELGIAKTKVKR